MQALADNGGATRTMRPIDGSVLVDAAPTCTDGIGTNFSDDQTAAPRPNGVRCDVGAYEVRYVIFRNDFE